MAVNPYGGTIIDLIRQGGADQAAALQRNGQIRGQMASDLGQMAQGTIGAILKERQQAPILAQEAKLRDLQVKTGEGQLAAQSRTAADQTAMDTALGQSGNPDDIEAQLPGHLKLPFREAWTKSEAAKQQLQTARQTFQTAIHESLGADAHGLTVIGADKNPEAVAELLNDAKAHGYAGADALLQQLQQAPDSAPQIVQRLVQGSSAQRKMLGEEADRTLRTTQEERAIQTAAQSQADRDADNKRADANAAEDARHHRALEAAARVSATGGSANDVRDAVQGMKDGTLPPLLPGRASKEYVAMLAEAKRQGYDLAGAATDWTATQKHIASLNGAQQLRMSQAIDNASHSLDVIDDLAGQWKGGKYPALNNAQLTAAKNGVLGPEAQKIAVQLAAQIADVTSELGNVYMGGNSPTDHALKLAQKNLSAGWSESTLKAMTAQARTNLRIRSNSMRNVGVAGASEGNPYAPPAGGGNADPLGILGK